MNIRSTSGDGPALEQAPDCPADREAWSLSPGNVRELFEHEAVVLTRDTSQTALHRTANPAECRGPRTSVHRPIVDEMKHRPHTVG